MTPVGPFEAARRALGLSVGDLWFRYFALGGMSTPIEVEAVLAEALVPSDHDHDLLAVALNERSVELGGTPTIAYLGDDPRDP